MLCILFYACKNRQITAYMKHSDSLVIKQKNAKKQAKKQNYIHEN